MAWSRGRGWAFRHAASATNAANGNLDLTDGIYIWPEGLAHYVFDHHVRLPPEFVEHVQARNELADDVHVDERWWRSVAPPAG